MIFIYAFLARFGGWNSTWLCWLTGIAVIAISLWLIKVSANKPKTKEEIA
jgi:SSS family solute:Na+ symporter